MTTPISKLDLAALRSATSIVFRQESGRANGKTPAEAIQAAEAAGATTTTTPGEPAIVASADNAQEWWSTELTGFGRREALKLAGLTDGLANVRWKSLSKTNQDKIWVVRDQIPGVVMPAAEAAEPKPKPAPAGRWFYYISD